MAPALAFQGAFDADAELAADPDFVTVCDERADRAREAFDAEMASLDAWGEVG